MNRAEIHKMICDKMHSTFLAKNADYGGSFSLLRKRYPNLAVIHISEKLARIEQLSSSDSEPQVINESLLDSYIDLANYAVMELTEREYDKQESDMIEKAIQQVNEKPYKPNTILWAVADDGVTERYNFYGGLNDIELEYDEEHGDYVLSVETLYAFDDPDKLVHWLDNLEVLLWKYVDSAEPDVTYELKWNDAFEVGSVITGQTMHECAEKFSFIVDAIARHVRDCGNVL